MAKSLEHHVRGICIDCGKAHDRWFNAWRCMDCSGSIKALQVAARRAVLAAMRRGDLPAVESQKCVDCGAAARDWEHRDYSKPLEVEAVCRSCNQQRGPAKWREAA